MPGLPQFPGPAVAAIGERLLGRVDALADELTDLIRREEPFYDAGTVVPTADLRGSVRDNLVYLLTRMAGRATASALAAPRATGRRRAEQGAPLPAILHSYRVGGTFLWAAILEDGLSEDRNAAELLPAASELWSIVDELADAVTDAYRDTVADRARSSAQTRDAVLEALLRGDVGDGSRLWESMAILRLPQRGTFVVVSAQPPQPGVESIPHAEAALQRRGIRSAWRVEIDAHVGVVVLTSAHGIDALADHLTTLAGGPVGISEAYTGLELTPVAARQARLAGATATPTSHEVIRYEQVPIAILLAGAADAATRVAESVLGPVLALPDAERDLLLDTLRSWFAHDGATAVAAASLHLHRNTVRYRLRRIEELTQRSLSRPTALAEIHLALEAVRVLRLPGGPDRWPAPNIRNADDG